MEGHLQRFNASQVACIRSPSDCEKKWYNILSKSRAEIAAFKSNLLRTGGGPPGKPLSALCEVVQRILGEDNAVISGVEGSQDPAAMKLPSLSQGYNEDAGESPDPASLNTGSPCASHASTSRQVSLAEDCIVVDDDGPAEDPLPDDLQALQREKFKLQIKVLRLQHEYYSLPLKKRKLE
ncbi:hypothetical protein SKAU_G00207940 [Synaphobranchus kaupii]|uniref:Uncharacterized protein n=1 Tax=Synaphobranchus kaupii TaxID=118154 RepID=A0A9Q1F8J0_SYNKA|nr:hypothetical protein SKAU_G00207940 [Synaphobranchus kaupii]